MTISICCLNFHFSVNNAKQKLKEKTESLKKTELSYKRDESVYENIKNKLSTLQVFFTIHYYFLSLGCQMVFFLRRSEHTWSAVFSVCSQFVSVLSDCVRIRPIQVRRRHARIHLVLATSVYATSCQSPLTLWWYGQIFSPSSPVAGLA